MSTGYDYWRPNFGRQTQQSSLFGDQFQLKLDPQIQADIEALRFRLMLGQLRSQIFMPDWSLLDPILSRPLLFQPSGGPLPRPGFGPASPPSPAGFCSFKPGAGPDTPRKAEAGDVLKAVWALPCVKHSVDRVQEDLERQWGQLTTGQAVLLVSHTVVIGAGAVAGIASDDATRIFVLEKLSGVDVPVPKVDGLKFRIYAPKGVVSGGGVTFSRGPVTVSGDMKPRTIGAHTYNDMSFTLQLDVLDAISRIRSRR